MLEGVTLKLFETLKLPEALGNFTDSPLSSQLQTRVREASILVIKGNLWDTPAFFSLISICCILSTRLISVDDHFQA